MACGSNCRTNTLGWMRRSSARWPGSKACRRAPIARCVSTSDRKSTRLNSSHSLHDALPICVWIELPDQYAWMDAEKQRTVARLEGVPEGAYRALRFHVRSEEHTSELQSLPPRRSSDLRVDRTAGPIRLDGCGEAAHGGPARRRAGGRLSRAAFPRQIGRAHV